MKILIVDDERTEHFALEIAMARSSDFSEELQKSDEHILKLARTYSEARHILESDELFDYLLLDHDLGDSDVYNDGTRLMNMLEEKMFLENKCSFKGIIPISSNPLGVKKIKEISERILVRHNAV